MKVKVCGMREADNIRAVEALDIDMMGFIFWPGSSRYVSEKPAYLPTHCKRVGVFVDADVSDIVQHVKDYGLDIIQLHGHESPEHVKALDGLAKIIKAISVSTSADIARYNVYEGLVDYFLFDTRMPANGTDSRLLPGGTGQQFDWTVLADYVGETPFLLSGGIGPDDAERLRAFRHPRCVGIDLNSRFEISPALKNVEQLKRFLNEYQQD